MTTIIVTHENNETDEFEFDSSVRSITLGRRSSNDVCIPDLSVSGTHATLSLNNGETILEDLNSTNGSYVNGSVIQRTVVHSGDEIILGKILISFKIDPVVDNTEHAVSSNLLDTADSTPASPQSDPMHQSKTARPTGLAADSSISQAVVSGNDAMNESENDSMDSIQSASVTDDDSDVAIATRPAAQAHVQESQKASEQSNGKAHPLDGIEHLVVPAAESAATPMHELDSPLTPSKGAVIEIKNGAKSGQILPIDKPVTTLGRPGIQIAAIMRKPDGYFLMHIESDDSVDRPTLNSDSVGDEPVLLHSGDALTVAGIDVEFMLS